MTAVTMRLLAFVTLPVAAMAPRGLPIVLGLLAILMTARHWREHKSLPMPPKTPALVALWVLAALALLSAVWSVDPGLSLEKAIGPIAILVALVLCLSALPLASAALRESFAKAVLGGAVVSLILMGIEIATDAAIFRWAHQDSLWKLPPLQDPVNGPMALNTAMSALAVLIWPVLWIAWHRRPGVAGMFAAAGILVFAFCESMAPPVALSLGVIAALIAYWMPRRVYRLLGIVLALGVIASPLLTKALPDPRTATLEYPGIPSSSVHRLMIWNATVGHIAQRPLLGWGFETSRTFSSKKDKESTVLMRLPSGALFHGNSEPIPLHPHNAMLQWWLELGVPGALAGAAILGFLVAGYGRLERGQGALSLGVTVTVLFMMATSFGAWQSWWLGTLALGGVLVSWGYRYEPPDAA